MLRTAILAAAAFALVACSPTQPPPSEPTPTEPAPTEPAPSEPTPPPEAPAPGQGEECADGACAEGLECVRYYGIAGPSGPEFTSCEIRCAGDASACPEGQTCVTIADGPGQVCRSE